MRYNVLHFFERKNIDISNILYLTRQNPLTKITFFDGKEILTAIPVKEIALYLPDKEFVNITKGILLRKSQIVNISDDGLYAMTDGSVFQGRKRNISQHKQLRQALGLSKEQNEKTEKMIPLELLEKCSILNDMPLAFCVIELVFDANGRGVDFVFRYCNEEMAVVEGIPVSEMLNNSFYEVFENGDKKWLVTYADVALNGTKVILHDYSPEIGKDLTIYCFQPHPGYCACILIPR
ncbi:hypothetical protein LIQ05_16060 [Blautia glucerasea]|uniref:hypothetical protein n=1 Tax=Blautia glucerasea TaxID=536633 RepID=UPI001D016000|nr:hypothetical protein [Blautia glucerasea]MCB5388488.1 hypothetical protein [Blautia glucerasea]MCB5422823.1 hypothetical protein [Blautia luti]